MISTLAQKAHARSGRAQQTQMSSGLGPCALGLGAVVAATVLGVASLGAGVFAPALTGWVVAIACVGGVGAFALRHIFLRQAAEQGSRDDAFATLIENVGDAVIRFDTRGGLAFASRSAETVLGCRRFELDGQGFFERVHVLDRPHYMQALAGATQDGAPETLEIRVRRDGAEPGYFWAELCLTPIEAQGPGPFTALCVLRDVTAKREADLALERAHAAAQSASEAKSRFLATIGHELRTPLNAIVGFSDMMATGIGGELSASHAEYAGLIKDSGHHLLEVINMLLDMSKIEAGKFEIAPETTDPARLTEPCLQLVAKAAQDRGVKLESVIGKGLPALVVDERACRQVLINLLTNAIKFSHEGGTVTLTAKRRGAMIQFSVRDEGIGMAPQTVKRLGEPFYQAHDGLNRHQEGTGLGLSIVQGLVQLHEGKLHIASSAGEGTTMTVMLPIAGPGNTRASAEIATLPTKSKPESATPWQNRNQKSVAS